MTSTHTSHYNHSSHGSHGSHGPHGNHGNHGSHASHGPHGSHGNSTYKSSTPSWSGSITGDHSVSSPTVQDTTFSSSTMGVKGGTGTLSALRAAAEAAKSASAFTTKNSAYTVPSAQVANQSSLSAVLQSAKGSIARYRNGTIKANFHTNHANSMGGGATNHSSHTSTSKSNTDSTSNSGVNVQSTLYTGSKGHSSTAQSAHANSSISSPQYTTSTSPSYSITKGTKITSAQISAIASQIKKITSSSIPSFGTYALQGSLGVSHGNHGSHASHGAHGSHGSHVSHGSHGPHGSHASHYSHSSCSKKFKTNIVPFERSALELLREVEIKEFNYLPRSGEDPNINHIGFIAEDTPEEFSTIYHDRMDYVNCIGLLIKACQELSQEVNLLKTLK